MRVKNNAMFLVALLAVLLFAGIGANSAIAAQKPLTGKGLEQLLAGEAKGKVLIVNFFASWCPPCKHEMPGLVSFRSSTPEKDVLLIGVSSDEDQASLDRFLKQHGVNFPVYAATPELLFTYEVTGIPRMLIFNQNGELVKDIIGVVAEDSLNSMVKILLENM